MFVYAYPSSPLPVLLSQPATRATSVGFSSPPSETELASKPPAPESDPAEPLEPEAAPELDPEELVLEPDPEEPLDPEAAPEPDPDAPPDPEAAPELDPEEPLDPVDGALCAVPPPEEEEQPASANGAKAAADQIVSQTRTRMVPARVPPGRAGHRARVARLPCDGNARLSARRR